MASEIRVTPTEISFLKSKFEQELKSRQANTELKWNSNPESYSVMVKFINDQLNKNSKSQIAVPATSLRNFFYKSGKNRRVRISSIDKLYKSLFGMPRDEYLEQNNYYFTEKSEFLLKAYSTEKELAVKGFEEQNLDVLDLTDNTEDEFLAQLEDQNSVVNFYIDANFLKDLNGIKILIELFYFRFVALVLDYKVRFFISKSLLSDGMNDDESQFYLNTFEGKIRVINYWKKLAYDENNKVSEIFRNYFDGNLDGKSYSDKLFGREFLFILDALIQFRVFNDYNQLKRQVSVINYLPIVRKIYGLDPEPLMNICNQIIYDNKNTDSCKFNFLGVTSFDLDSSIEQKIELLTYYGRFGKNVVKNGSHNSARVFTIPAKRVKRKGWSSTLSEDINTLVFQYLYLNLNCGVKVFLLTYDKDKINNSQRISWNQDFVLRYRNTNNDLGIDEVIENMKTNVRQSNLDILDVYVPSSSDRDDGAKLYFGYQQEASGLNRMLTVTDQLFITRFYKDFSDRMNINKHELYAALTPANSSDLSDTLSILNLNQKKSGSIDSLKAEAELFNDI